MGIVIVRRYRGEKVRFDCRSVHTDAVRSTGRHNRCRCGERVGAVLMCVSCRHQFHKLRAHSRVSVGLGG